MGKAVVRRKRVTVRLGDCGTCGRAVIGYVEREDFIDREGHDLTIAVVEGHCGIPTHATRRGRVMDHEFRKAAHGETI